MKSKFLKKNRIKGEYFKIGDTLKAVVKSVNIDKIWFDGRVIKNKSKILENLLTLEVPELKDEKKIIIESSARIPGSDQKIALISTSPQNGCNGGQLLV